MCQQGTGHGKEPEPEDPFEYFALELLSRAPPHVANQLLHTLHAAPLRDVATQTDSVRRSVWNRSWQCCAPVVKGLWVIAVTVAVAAFVCQGLAMEPDAICSSGSSSSLEVVGTTRSSKLPSSQVQQTTSIGISTTATPKEEAADAAGADAAATAAVAAPVAAPLDAPAPRAAMHDVQGRCA
eukprot:CAMPEP_0172839258 /NCGR_PEP_ID=MMETSP1075-20121228/28434_1 /TAXON_ID=2916 /ORGANISM="Ceratium fusus, Strain PA161109" /LENGTH=181 /DNA_ID=CAMNT_0013682875 /DNA_START=86 /DNA_END=627 /DNA_ORIENTATION=-